MKNVSRLIMKERIFIGALLELMSKLVNIFQAKEFGGSAMILVVSQEFQKIHQLHQFQVSFNKAADHLHTFYTSWVPLNLKVPQLTSKVFVNLMNSVGAAASPIFREF